MSYRKKKIVWLLILLTLRKGKDHCCIIYKEEGGSMKRDHTLSVCKNKTQWMPRGFT